MIKKIIITVIALGAIFAIYWFVIRMTKPKAIKYIIKAGMYNDSAALNSWDEQSLYNWVKAIKKAEMSFLSNGKAYNVMGGKAL